MQNPLTHVEKRKFRGDGIKQWTPPGLLGVESQRVYKNHQSMRIFVKM
ncbi:hypothetical protein [Symmachiella macrocystis]|nr:hypothetical protein [Symmachiella macrocystis]